MSLAMNRINSIPFLQRLGLYSLLVSIAHTSVSSQNVTLTSTSTRTAYVCPCTEDISASAGLFNTSLAGGEGSSPTYPTLLTTLTVDGTPTTAAAVVTVTCPGGSQLGCFITTLLFPIGATRSAGTGASSGSDVQNPLTATSSVLLSSSSFTSSQYLVTSSSLSSSINPIGLATSTSQLTTTISIIRTVSHVSPTTGTTSTTAAFSSSTASLATTSSGVTSTISGGNSSLTSSPSLNGTSPTSNCTGGSAVANPGQAFAITVDNALTQVESYIGFSSNQAILVNSPSQAVPFSIDLCGVLSVYGTNLYPGAGALVGAQLFKLYGPGAGDQLPATYSGWTDNSVLAYQQATFCIKADGTIFMTFGVALTGCVTLTVDTDFSTGSFNASLGAMLVSALSADTTPVLSGNSTSSSSSTSSQQGAGSSTSSTTTSFTQTTTMTLTTTSSATQSSLTGSSTVATSSVASSSTLSTTSTILSSSTLTSTISSTTTSFATTTSSVTSAISSSLSSSTSLSTTPSSSITSTTTDPPNGIITSSATSSPTTSTTSSTSTPSTSLSTSASTEATTSSSSTTTTSTTTTTTSLLPTTTLLAANLGVYEVAVLEEHNRHRSNHSAPDLTWNTTQADIALSIAQTCDYKHNTTAGGGGYGQNIGAGAHDIDVPGLITNLMYNGEIGNFPLPYGNNTPDMTNFESWGHFSQIVWETTTSVGCATYDCSSAPGGLQNVGNNVPPYFTVCNYYPPGNYIGLFARVQAPLGDDVVVISD